MDHKTTEPDPQAPASTSEDVAMTDAQTLADMKDMKLVVMDSAELATRAASLAANAGLDLRNATKDVLQGNLQMLASNKKQSKFAIILLASAASLMLLTAALFVFMSLKLQGRVAQLDEMVLAVGKRVVEMDASLELVGGAQEVLKSVAAKQAEMAAGQAKIDARLEEVIKNAQGVPEQTAKPIEHSRWMLRILDPVRALSMRGHAREGEARVRVRVIRSSATSCCSASYEAGE